MQALPKKRNHNNIYIVQAIKQNKQGVQYKIMENKSQSDSSDSDASVGCCGNCGETDVNVEFCYGCKEDYCEHCGVASGGCGVCDAEEDAWNKFDEAVNTILDMPCSKEAKPSIRKLTQFMRSWKDAVECGEDDILCMSFMGGGTHDAADIMTDCGDVVIDEMNWYKKKAHEICKGKATFDMEFQ